MNANTLDVLAAAWREAKAAEAAANACRLEIEAQIVAALPAIDTESTVTQEIPGGVVSVKYGVSRKVDSDALSASWANLTPAQRDAFRWTAAINLKQLRAVQKLLPQEYAQLAPFVEVKPSKPTVTVEEA